MGSVYQDDLGICAHYGYMCNCFGVLVLHISIVNLRRWWVFQRSMLNWRRGGVSLP